MSARVVVLGDVMLDVVVRPTAAIATASDTPSDVRVTRGGAGANVAMALRGEGHAVRYVGAAGADDARVVVERALAAGGVAPRLQTVSSSTGTVVSIVAKDGQRSMLTDRGANSSLSWDFVSSVLDDPFDHLHVSGYVLLDSATQSVGERALVLARERGATTSCDAGSLAPLRSLGVTSFRRASVNAATFFANESEARALTSTSSLEDALALLVTSFDEVVVTRGARGAIVGRGDDRVEAPAFDAPVVDTTGAGDAVTGAYLGARLRGDAPTVALARAMLVASRVVGALGADGYSRT